MKITNEDLKKMIREELEASVEEAYSPAPQQMGGAPKYNKNPAKNPLVAACASFKEMYGKYPTAQDLEEAIQHCVKSSPMG